MWEMRESLLKGRLLNIVALIGKEKLRRRSELILRVYPSLEISTDGQRLHQFFFTYYLLGTWLYQSITRSISNRSVLLGCWIDLQPPQVSHESDQNLPAPCDFVARWAADQVAVILFAIKERTWAYDEPEGKIIGWGATKSFVFRGVSRIRIEPTCRLRSQKHIVNLSKHRVSHVHGTEDWFLPFGNHSNIHCFLIYAICSIRPPARCL